MGWDRNAPFITCGEWEDEWEPKFNALMAEIERLREAVEDAVDTLEAMNLHIDNPLYDRLRKVIDSDWR